MTAARPFAVPLALVVVLIALAFDLWKPTEPIGIDYHTYAAAARVGLQHGWAQIYDQSLVADEQKQLVTDQLAQPFLSPPTAAWLAALLAPFPYWPSYYVWAVLSFMAFALALLWSSLDRGLERWVVAGAALAPWWVLHAVHLGQIVPFVAAGVVLAYRLVRERREVAAGVALALAGLKPNTALLVPFALLAARRYRTFATLTVVAVAVGASALATMGTSGISAYLSQITGPLPSGADYLTVEGAFGVGGVVANGLRILIVAACLATAFRLHPSPGLAIAVGTLGSLLVAPYLHGSDLCLLSAAAWIVWEERRTLAWRIPLVAGWIAASPFVTAINMGPTLQRWPLIELALLVAIIIEAWRPRRTAEAPLTGGAELRARTPA